ncbi:MAG: nucleotidyltransferase domain-containing protein [Betaproteobacteria bacterium]|nr:nucleotidyltransferase domain-containing protein [Betaproteobacteria bacterium]
MRLTPAQAQAIHRLAQETAGEAASVLLFGSRLDDHAKGGDVDLLLQVPDPVDNPAQLAALFSARVTRLMEGRKVDVVLLAPNLLRLPIHDIALREGQRL